jgi:predicted neuraminidase
VLWIDQKNRLWFFWQTIVANEWHTAVTQIRISSDYLGDGPPKWDSSQPLFIKPHNIEERVKQELARAPEGVARKFWERMAQRAGDKYFSRMGWMGRAKPLQLPSGRILLPLYSDGFSFSLAAISDDHGETWVASEPILGGGSVQPSFARRRDGTIVAYMRDNGPPPKRVLVSESRDNGETWTVARDLELHNPGTGIEVQVLKDGRWLLINNDTERGRHRLTLTLSDDEGRTWKWSRALEYDQRPERAGSFHYPSIMQGASGEIHASYSVFLNHVPEGEPRKTIRYARFNPEWVEAGEAQ